MLEVTVLSLIGLARSVIKSELDILLYTKIAVILHIDLKGVGFVVDMNKIVECNIASLYHRFLQNPSVCTDSRSVKEGDFFVALKGANFDGNLFALKALEAGASWAVVSDKHIAECSSRCLYVADTLTALQQLAQMYRRAFDIPVIAITGTNGKTTTKELMHEVLRQKYRVLATEGNLNNHIGVPLTLLRLTPRDEVAIIEMGASAKGEIALLASIAEPTHGVITNIGKAHLEGFGSQEGILHAKSELVEYLLKHSGTYLLNADDPLLWELWKGHHFPCYGLNPREGGEDMVASALVESLHPLLSVLISGMDEAETIRVQSHLIGAYNAQNLLAATAMGQLLQVPLLDIKRALESYTPHNHRSQSLQLNAGITLILDCYNANPSSMIAALENLAEVVAPHKLAILGDMKELGEASLQEHQQILHWLQQHADIQAVLCGEEFGRAKATAMPSSDTFRPQRLMEDCGRRLMHFSTISSLQSYIEQLTLEDRTAILLKGSRSIKLEEVIPQIKAVAEKSMP